MGSMSAVSQSASIGINLSNIRAYGATISSPPSGFSGLVNFDAASMYPSTMSNNYNINKPSYHVSSIYPFEVKRLSISDALNDKEWREGVGFSRRIEAEKCKIECLLNYHKQNGDDIKASEALNNLKSIEEDHPEWMI